MTRISQEAGEEIQALTKGGFLATEGFTPLHYACERRPPLEVVEALITTWPESVTTRLQPGGALPLHTACTWQASVEVVEAICLAEPAACRIPDDLGNIPLHCAVFSGTAIGVVEVLLRTFPKSVTARNLQGSLPIDIIKRLRHINRRSVLGLVNTTLRSLSSSTISRSNGSHASVALRATEMKKV
jgi:ankyrin repeat protein